MLRSLRAAVRRAVREALRLDGPAPIQSANSGSLDFLAPERAQGRQPGPASDIWSLGAMLYAAVEGGSPFRRTSTWSTLSAIVTEPLPEPHAAGALAPVLAVLLAKEPEARPDAQAARESLEALARGSASPGGAAFGPPTEASVEDTRTRALGARGAAQGTGFGQGAAARAGLEQPYAGAGAPYAQPQPYPVPAQPHAQPQPTPAFGEGLAVPPAQGRIRRPPRTSTARTRWSVQAASPRTGTGTGRTTTRACACGASATTPTTAAAATTT